MMLELTEQTQLAPGFANYAAASQQVFRLALECLSRPCRAVEFPGELAPSGAPLPPVPAALALSILDALTPIWLSPSWRKAENWLRFHRGCPMAASPAEAGFVLAAALDELPPLAALNQGSPRYPDSSATVILYSGLSPKPRNDTGTGSAFRPEVHCDYLQPGGGGTEAGGSGGRLQSHSPSERVKLLAICLRETLLHTLQSAVDIFDSIFNSSDDLSLIIPVTHPCKFACLIKNARFDAARCRAYAHKFSETNISFIPAP